MAQELWSVGTDPTVLALLRQPRTEGWTEAQARLVLACVNKSGLSIQEFARRLGVNTWRLYKWQRRLLAKQPAGPLAVKDAAANKKVALPSPFVPVPVVPSSPEIQGAAPGTQSSAAAVCAELVHPSGGRLRLYGSLPASWLGPLYQAMGTPC